MTAVAVTRTWLRRMAAAAPSAWQYDPVFRWAAIGAGIALAMLVLRLADPLPCTQAPPLRRPDPPVPAASPGATASGSWPVPPPSPRCRRSRRVGHWRP